jgi:hypothetical protein
MRRVGIRGRHCFFPPHLSHNVSRFLTDVVVAHFVFVSNIVSMQNPTFYIELLLIAGPLLWVICTMQITKQKADTFIPHPRLKLFK